jgi:hypothetical protein
MKFCTNVISTCGRPHVRVKSCVFWDAVCDCAAVSVSVIRVDESASCMGGCGDYRFRLGLRLDPYNGCGRGGMHKINKESRKTFQVDSLPAIGLPRTLPLLCLSVSSSTWLCAAAASTLLMEAAGSFQMPVHLCQTTQCHNPEDRIVT